MDRDKLAKLRKKSAEAKATKHKELLDSNASIKEAVLELHKAINDQQPYDDSQLVSQLKELKESQTFTEDIKRLETALKSSSSEEKLDQVIKAVGNINNRDVVNAVNGLIVKLEENSPSQSEENYQPVRRVIKVGQRLVFDDFPTPLSVGGGVGGGGGASVQQPLIRNGNSIAVVNPDGTPLAGGGDATAANQVTQTGVLEQIRGFDIPVYTKIVATYPSDSVEVYTYLDGATEVADITVTYTDDTKDRISEVELNAT